MADNTTIPDEWMDRLREDRERKREAVASQIPEEWSKRLKTDQKRIENQKESNRLKRKMLMETYVKPLTDHRGPRRKAAARKAAREITSPVDRVWVAKQVQQRSEAIGAGKKEAWKKKGFAKKAIESALEVTTEAFEGGTDIGEEYAGLGRAMVGGDTKQDRLQYQQLLESAHQAGDPKNQNESNWFWKNVVLGGARLAPRVGVGAAAYKTGGVLGLGTQVGTAAYPGIREEQIAEGSNPVVASLVAAPTAGAVGAIEGVIPIPFIPKGKAMSLGVGAAEKLAKKAGLGKTGTALAKGAATTAVGYAGETLVEEPAQRTTEMLGRMLSAGVSGTSGGPGVGEIPGEALEAAKGALGPMLPISLLGGGAHAAKVIKSQGVRARIEKFASENKAPSRKEFVALGFRLADAETAKERLSVVKDLAEAWATSDKAGVDVEAAPTEESPQDQALRAQMAAIGPQPQIDPADIRQEPSTAGQRLPAEQAAPATEAPVAVVEEGVVEPPTEAPVSVASDVGKLLTEEAGAIPLKKKPEGLVAGLPKAEAQKAMTFNDSEHEKSWVASFGMDVPGQIRRIGRGIRTLWRASTRANIHISNKPEMDVAKEVWRGKRNSKDDALNTAIRDMSRTVEGLSSQQYELAARYLTTKNQLRALNMDVVEPLRHMNKSEEAVLADEVKLRPLVEGTPEVVAALEAHQEIVDNLVKTLHSQGLLPDAALANTESYMHQQVLEQRKASNYGKKGKGVGKKSFQKKRATGPREMSEENNYNTNYIESEIAWMTNAHHLMRENELNKKLEDRYDRYSEFDEKARLSGKTLQAEARKEGYGLIGKDELYSSSASVTEQVRAQFSKDLNKELNASKEEIELAAGEAIREVALPLEIIEQIRADAEAAGSRWTQITVDMLNAWKAWTLLNPTRIFGYNMRNWMGDIDPALVAYPGMLMEFRNTWRDMKHMAMTNEPLTPIEAASSKHGAIGSGLSSEEFTRVGNLPIIKRLTGGKARRRGVNPLTVYMNAAKAGTQFRENFLRHATFRHVLKKIEANELKHFGATKESTVREVQKWLGDEAAAARVTRDLIGDYGNLTEMGNFFRASLLPFWAFVEINTKRWPRILANTLRSPGYSAKTALGTVAAKVLVIRTGQMYGLLWAWNNLAAPAIFGGDPEEELSSDEKKQPGIIVGRFSDGTIWRFRNVGALGELFETFGINEAVSMLPRLASGQIDFSDIGMEMLKAPVEKIVNLMHPGIKAVPGVLGGKSPYPEPLGVWRTVDKAEEAASVVGLQDLLKEVRGRTTDSGERGRAGFFTRFFVASIDPRRQALNETYDLRNEYLKSIGSEEKMSYPMSEYRFARAAASNDDYNAFVEWRKDFLEKHGDTWDTRKKWSAYLKRIDPLSSKLSEINEWRFQHKYLKDEQRDKVRRGREYASVLSSRLAEWWTKDAKEKRK